MVRFTQKCPGLNGARLCGSGRIGDPVRVVVAAPLVGRISETEDTA